MNKKDPFDKKIKDSIEQFEAPFDDTPWKNIQSQLPAPSVWNITKGWIGAGIVAIAIGGYLWFSSSSEEKAPVEVESIKAKEQVIEKPDFSVSEEKEFYTPFESSETEENPVEDDGTENPVQGQVEEQSTQVVASTKKKDIDLIEEDDPTIELEKPEAIEDETIGALSIKWTLSSSTICQDDFVNVGIEEMNQPVDMFWDFGDGYRTKNAQHAHAYKLPGTYVIKLEASSLLDDQVTLLEERVIEVKPKPAPDFSIEFEEYMAEKPEVHIQNLSKNYAEIRWKTPHGDIEEKEQFSGFYPHKGRYDVSLYVKNKFGCVDSITRSFDILSDYTLMAAELISPNGDGRQDTFMPEALYKIDQAFVLQIINPLDGKTIYESSSLNAPWDGKHQDTGMLMPKGKYAWTVKLDDGSIYRGILNLADH
jgi:gliding motility-associated-like protein